MFEIILFIDVAIDFKSIYRIVSEIFRQNDISVDRQYMQGDPGWNSTLYAWWEI